MTDVEARRAKHREAARLLVAAWPPLTPAQRIRLAVLLRPDMPIGIERTKPSASKEQAA